MTAVADIALLAAAERRLEFSFVRGFPSSDVSSANPSAKLDEDGGIRDPEDRFFAGNCGERRIADSGRPRSAVAKAHLGANPG